MNYFAVDSRKLPLPEDKELEGLVKCQVLWPADFPFRPLARYYPTVDELPLAMPAALRPQRSISFEHNFMMLDGSGFWGGAGPGFGGSAFAAMRQMRG